MIQVIDKKISEQELKIHLGKPFSEMIKFVVDILREKIALGGEMHSDGDAILLRDGSSQDDLWGGNYYPGLAADQKIKYTSLVNIRPRQGNTSVEVLDKGIRIKMRGILKRFLP